MCAYTFASSYSRRCAGIRDTREPAPYTPASKKKHKSPLTRRPPTLRVGTLPLDHPSNRTTR